MAIETVPGANGPATTRAIEARFLGAADVDALAEGPLQLDTTLGRADMTCAVTEMLAEMNDAAKALHLQVSIELDHRDALVTRTVSRSRDAVDTAMAELGVREGRTLEAKSAAPMTRGRVLGLAG